MAVETELKLSIAPEHVSRLKRHPLLKSLSASRATTRKLYSVYYDTPELALRNHAMALRLRRVGKRWFQTLKGGGGVQAGLHRRNEWETPVAGEALEFDTLRAAGGALAPGIARRLKPAFVTDFARSARVVKFEGAEIELALDAGEIRAGKRTRPISELELELISGEPRQLFRLALAISDIVPLAIESTSKAEYGYRLFTGELPVARRVEWPVLRPLQPAAGALLEHIAASVQQVQASLRGAIGARDDAALHEFQDGLRRLQGSMKMAWRFRRDAELRALQREVSALADALANARAWDTFLTRALPSLDPGQIDDSVARAVRRASRQHIARSRAELDSLLVSPEIQRLLLRIGAWMHGRRWAAAAAAHGPTLEAFAAQALNERYAHLAGKAAAGAMDVARCLALQAASEELCCSMDVFASLYGREGRRMLAALMRLREALDALHDLAAARRLLGELREHLTDPALDAVRRAIERAEQGRRAACAKTIRQFGAQSLFRG